MGNKLDILEFFISRTKNYDINGCDITGKNLLHIAAKKGLINIVNFLLDQKNINPMPFDENGSTPLSLACRNWHIEVVKRLLSIHNAIQNAELYGDWSLLEAIDKGHTNIVDLLIQYGSNFNRIDFDLGNSPLIVAVIKNNIDIVKILLNLGSDKTVINGQNKTAADIALEHNYTNIYRLLTAN